MKAVDDCDTAFIFLWIAFNAMYGQAVQPGNESEKTNFETYLNKIRLKSDRMDAVMQNISADVEKLLNNKYVFEPFWKHHNGLRGYEDWERRLKNRKKERESAWYKKTEVTLHQLFESIYVLRNQLLHGSATYSGSLNRHQVTTGAKIMATLVPHFIDVMIRHPRPDGGWGTPCYPVVRETGPQSGWTGRAGSK